MENRGIDVHKKESQLCIITEAGEVLELRIRTERGRFKEELGARGKAKVLMEASTESEWVARCLEEMGHEAAGRTTSKLVPGGNHVETFTRADEGTQRNHAGEGVVRAGKKIVGFDLNEVSPGQDGSEWDGNVGARLLYKMIGWTLVSQGLTNR